MHKLKYNENKIAKEKSFKLTIVQSYKYIYQIAMGVEISTNFYFKKLKQSKYSVHPYFYWYIFTHKAWFLMSVNDYSNIVPKQMFFLEPMKLSWNFIGFLGPMKKNMNFHRKIFIFYEIRDTLLLLLEEKQ